MFCCCLFPLTSEVLPQTLTRCFEGTWHAWEYRRSRLRGPAWKWLAEPYGKRKRNKRKKTNETGGLVSRTTGKMWLRPLLMPLFSTIPFNFNHRRIPGSPGNSGGLICSTTLNFRFLSPPPFFSYYLHILEYNSYNIIFSNTLGNL